MTYPIYLEDSYAKEMQATVISVAPEAQGRWQVVLDKTVFYPRGGGQSTDQGTLSSEHWDGKVYQVLQKDDRIIHYVEAKEAPTTGSSVQGTIDWNRRYLHMRLHSAAHVVDFALYLLHLSPSPLMPLKGDHGKKPFICYQGIIEEDFQKKLEAKANELVEQNLFLRTHFVKGEDIEKSTIYLQPGLPKNKPLRLLTLEGVGSVADGGTQVHSTSEVGKIAILPLEKKEGMTLVHYNLVK